MLIISSEKKCNLYMAPVLFHLRIQPSINLSGILRAWQYKKKFCFVDITTILIKKNQIFKNRDKWFEYFVKLLASLDKYATKSLANFYTYLLILMLCFFALMLCVDWNDSWLWWKRLSFCETCYCVYLVLLEVNLKHMGFRWNHYTLITLKFKSLQNNMLYWLLVWLWYQL